MKVFIVLVFFLSIPLVSALDTKETALAALSHAQECQKAMIDAALSTMVVDDLLTQARQILERADLAESLAENQVTGPSAELIQKSLQGLRSEDKTYQGSRMVAEKVCRVEEEAFYILDSLEVFAQQLEEKYRGSEEEPVNPIAGQLFAPQKKQLVNTTDAEALLAQAKKAFEEERYEDANNLILQARANLDEKEAQITTVNLLTAAGRGFLEQYWPHLLFASVLVALAMWVGWKKKEEKKLKRKIRSLHEEKKVILELVKKAQRERFEKGTLSDSVYQIRMAKYNERLAKVKQMLPVLEDAGKKKSQRKKIR